MMADKQVTEWKNRIEISNNVYSVLVSFCCCIGCIGITASENSISYTNSFLSIIIFGLSLYLTKNLSGEFRTGTKRQKIYAYIFAVLLSIALHMGAQLELHDRVDFKNVWLYVEIICLTLFLAPIVNRLWNCVFRNKGSEDVKKNDEKPLGLMSIWLVIFLLWIPTFLAFFPGAFIYDAFDEYLEVIMRVFSTHHPLLHVLLLGGIVHAGEYLGIGANAGIAIYTILQMTVMSLVFAYVIKALQGFGIRKKYLLGMIVFVGVFPLFPMYAVCSAKDTTFTGAFLLIVVLLIQFVYEQNQFWGSRMLLFVIASVVMMLLRNNGFYSYVVAIPFTALMLIKGIDKKNWIKLVTLMILSIVLYKGSEYCLKTALKASDNEHQEILTVPIQQLAYVYNYAAGSITEEQKETLYEIIPKENLGYYTPRNSDPVKFGFDNEKYTKETMKYVRLWFDIGKKQPLMYLNAWLVNSYGYWYPDAINNVYEGNSRYTFQYKDSSYFAFETEEPGTRMSLFPLLERLYRNISLELFQQKVPVVSMLFSPGFVFWVFIIMFVGIMRQKQWHLVAVSMPVLLLVGTVLLGPTVLVRYVLILWFMLPLYLLINKSSSY